MKKFNPGHYLQAKSPGSSELTDLAPALSLGFTGALVDIPWAALEPTRGAYDFTLILNYLRWAETHNKQLVLMLFDRDFRTPPDRTKIVPRWLMGEGLAQPFNDSAGTIAKIWRPEVTAYRIQLIEAIAAEFDDHAHLEAVALPETALGGITPANAPTFSKEGYRDQIITLIQAVAPVMKQTQLWQSLNWLGPAHGRYLDQIARAIADTGVGGITNPDSVPWAPDKPMYGTLKRFAGKIAIAVGGDTSQLGHPASNPYYKSLDELVVLQYRFGQQLGANYQLWDAQFTSRAVSGGRYSADYSAAIERFLASAPLLSSARPASLTGLEPEPQPQPIDRATLRALLEELEPLPGQLTEWIGKLRAVVG